MKVTLVKVPRRPPWPLWAIGLVVGWLGVTGAAVWLMQRYHQHVVLCAFKRLTGYPCPTCGATRGVLRLLHGDVAGAWQFNPLLFSVLAGGVALLAFRLAFGRVVRVQASRRQRRIAWAVAIVLVLINWAYLVVYVG